jgi:hypothetical protein
MNTMSDVIRSLPQTTVRPVIFNDEKITDELIIGYLGKLKKIKTKWQPRAEVVVPIVQALKDKQFRRVHALAFHKQSVTLGVSIGGMPPYFSDSSSIAIQRKVTKVWKSSVPRCFFMLYDQDWCTSTYWDSKMLTVPSKNGAQFGANYRIDDGICSINSVSPKKSSPGNFETSPRKVCAFKTGTMIAFDGSSSGEKFVLVEEIKTETSATRVVRLYKPDNEEPVATYTPPTKTFEPTDVCFWRFEDEDKLLIADWQNDAIHVVDTKDDDLKFERYLAPGSGHLFKPTALNLDVEGNVLVGCENGWVLVIEKMSPQEEHPKPGSSQDSDADDDDNDDADDNGDISSTSENASEATSTASGSQD